MKNDLLNQVLETRKAKCLIPLIDMIGDLDGMIENGIENFIDEIPKQIKVYQHELNDIDHILEDSYDVLSDMELIDYSKRRGEVRRTRRFKKNEGVFLGRDGVTDLLESFIKLLSAANKSVTEAESQVYLTRVLAPPSCSNKVINSKQDTVVNISEPTQTTPNQKSKLDSVVQQNTDSVDNNEKVDKLTREYTTSDILHSPKDSMVVVEGIKKYRDIILMDYKFKIDTLMDNWRELFSSADADFKKEILLDSYIAYYSNIENSMEKCIADFAVWNHILPKKLIEINYYSK